MVLNSIETFVDLGTVCPVCGGNMELSVGLDLVEGKEITAMWMCSGCDPTNGHNLIYGLSMEFNRPLSSDEQELIHGAIAGLRQKQRDGQDISSERIDLIKLGVYCMYTLRFVDYTTGEESVHEVDARAKVDLAKILKAVRMEHLRDSILDPKTDKKDANRMLKELVQLEKLHGREAFDYVMAKIKHEQDEQSRHKQPSVTGTAGVEA